jgi:hypothetical protein
MTELTPAQLAALRDYYAVEVPPGSAERSLAAIHERVRSADRSRFDRIRSQLADLLEDLTRGVTAAPAYAAGVLDAEAPCVVEVSETGAAALTPELAGIVGEATIGLNIHAEVLVITTSGLSPSFEGDLAVAIQESLTNDPIVVFISHADPTIELGWTSPLPTSIALAAVRA